MAAVGDDIVSDSLLTSVVRASSMYYPIMLTQQAGEISESKACEMLGMNIEEYRDFKQAAITATMTFIEKLPCPLIALVKSLPSE